MALPEIETPRLWLRPRGLHDLNDCLSMDRDPEVTKFVDGPWHDEDVHREFVIARMRKGYPAGLGYWALIPKRDRAQFLGWIMLLPGSQTGPDVEVGWRFNRRSWGKGYATEAAGAAMEHGFSTVEIPRIYAEIDRRNAASIGVAEKIGMTVSESTTAAERLNLVFERSRNPQGTQ